MAGHVGYRQADDGEAVCESSVSGDAPTVKALARNGCLDTLWSDQSAYAAVASTRQA